MEAMNNNTRARLVRRTNEGKVKYIMKGKIDTSSRRRVHFENTNNRFIIELVNRAHTSSINQQKVIDLAVTS